MMDVKSFFVVTFIVFLTLLSCGEQKPPAISLKTYAEFRSRCLLLSNVYPKDTKERREMIAKTMGCFDIDSIKLANFFKFYEKNPTKWIEVETAVQNKLKELSKRRNTDG